MTSPTQPSPQERLEISRRAIVRHMNRNDASDDEQDPTGPYGERGSSEAEGGTWGFIKHAFGAWWQHHPVSAAFSLARPVLGDYAREKPWQLLGIAAAAGAAAVVLKPWRVVSMGGLLVAALKSSEISATLLSLLSRPAQDNDHSQSQRTR
jgi:hypothetical protein